MGSRSTERALGVLEQVAALQPAAAGEIAGALGMPRSTLYLIIDTLVEHGFVARDASGRLVVGHRAYEIGTRWTGQEDDVTITEARRWADGLAEELDEVSHVGVRDGAYIIYVHKAQSTRQSVQIVSEVGRRLPAHATALGKVLLSDLERNHFLPIYAGAQLQSLTPTTITDVEDLWRVVSETRVRGYAIDDQESSKGVWCFSAPVRNARGNVIAALSVSVPEYRASASVKLSVQDAVVRAVSRRATDPAPTPQC